MERRKVASIDGSQQLGSTERSSARRDSQLLVAVGVEYVVVKLGDEVAEG
jgi:hypothetical protein